ncbi:hypothetical protein [Rhodanobacter sp. OR444]|nr:hypothetical protein [Rhodanobacter sp. OR444]
MWRPVGETDNSVAHENDDKKTCLSTAVESRLRSEREQGIPDRVAGAAEVWKELFPFIRSHDMKKQHLRENVKTRRGGKIIGEEFFLPSSRFRMKSLLIRGR